jgi:hypothetical protein
MKKSPGVILEDKKIGLTGRIGKLMSKFSDDSIQDKLDGLNFAIDQDQLGSGHPKRISIGGVKLEISAKDEQGEALDKVDAFLKALEEKVAADEKDSGKPVRKGAADVAADAEAVVAPLVPEKARTEWRDVNVEIVKIAKAFEGTKFGDLMKELRKMSHKKEIGKEDINIQFGEDVLEIWADDSDPKILLKLAKFVKDLKRHNSEKFPAVSAKTTVPETKKEEEKDPIFWRDVISGIDGLLKAYPDEEFPALSQLREMLENGEVGKGMHLFLTVGDVHLWIKQKDEDEEIKEKIAVFIGELKQVASNNDKEKSKPLDSAADKTYWRDILGALEELQDAYGVDKNFKLLKLSIEKGTLGTVKSFHAVIDGVTLDIIQSDTDTEMKDKISDFIRKLTKTGEVKIKDVVRIQLKEAEKEYRDLQSKHMDLENRYNEQFEEMKQRADQIRRLKNENTRYERTVEDLQEKLRDAKTRIAPAPRTTTRSYSG